MQRARTWAAWLILLCPWLMAWPAPAGDQDKEPVFRGTSLSTWRQRLQSQEPWQRDKAVTAIGMMGPAAKAALPDLVNLLKQDSSLFVRLAAGTALGRLQKAALPALPDLVAAVNDSGIDLGCFEHSGECSLRDRVDVGGLCQFERQPAKLRRRAADLGNRRDVGFLDRWLQKLRLATTMGDRGRFGAGEDAKLGLVEHEDVDEREQLGPDRARRRRIEDRGRPRGTRVLEERRDRG